MNKIKIIADSTCDLSEELIEKYDIKTVPLHVELGDKSYDDTVNITPEDIYKWSDEHDATPKTAAPNINEVIEVFDLFKDKYDEIICFTISSEMSSSYQSFVMATDFCEIKDRVSVIDSRNLSTGISLLIIKAAKMIEEGKTAEQIRKEIDALIPNIRSSFVIDTLTYLHRGGRCSSIAAIAGNALKLHPIIKVADGKMHPDRKLRGRMDKVFMEYLREIEPGLKNADTDTVFITHSGVDQSIIDNIKHYIEDNYHFDEILITQANCVISSHCGPNTLGVLYIEKTDH